MQKTTSYWKTWEETMGETTWIGFGTRPRAESQIQVCDTRRVGSAQLAKNAENSPSAHHISLQSLSEWGDVSMKQRSSEMMMYDKT